MTRRRRVNGFSYYLASFDEGMGDFGLRESQAIAYGTWGKIPKKQEKRMDIRLLDDRILVKPLEAESYTPGGIAIPDMAKKKHYEGHVTEVGPGRLLPSGQRVPLGVNVDDRVMYDQYGGTEVKVDGQAMVLLREHAILVVLEDA